ncbi:expressed unknown protein [Seminavis robusta]|uniref:Uncharacterized protein n=1 Tax=Seminavis robusta TaxID=568900 RepID=A0A9N8DNW9_9STRA|nr:expressed unknown protein [Seminavis robusta]|eukprot:Sro235_g094640.1 n/a (446) ;mRNA; f:11600-12937
MNSASCRLLTRRVAQRLLPSLQRTSLLATTSRIPQHRFLASAAVVIPTSSQDARLHPWLWLTAAATTAAVLMVGSTTRAACQEEETAPSKEEEALLDPDNLEIGPDDPYYSIPDDDEPTDCSMCLTFRQGPCRLDWKRFELCVKDKSPPKKDDTATTENSSSSEEEEPPKEDPTACMKYAMPFYQCSSKHVNSYLILGNDQTQKTVTEPLLKTYVEDAPHRRLCFAPDNNNNAVTLDFTQWETFVTTLVNLGGSVPTRFELKKTGFKSPADALRATWEKKSDDNDNPQYLMMNEEGEPFLITVTAQVPMEQALAGKTAGKKKKKTKKKKTKQKTAPLMMTFALDQHGNLIGDARNSSGDDDNNKNKKEEETPPPTHLPLQIQVVPGVTQEITIYALYVPKDGDFLEDGTLYESKPYQLQSITEQAMETAKAQQQEKEAEGVQASK